MLLFIKLVFKLNNSIIVSQSVILTKRVCTGLSYREMSWKVELLTVTSILGFFSIGSECYVSVFLSSSQPNPLQGSTPPDHTTVYKMFDRVTNVRDGYSVPLGARGTVIGQ